MKTKLSAILLSLLLIQNMFGQTPVTFTVDIAGAGLTPDANGVHIAGNFADPNYDGSVLNPGYTNWSPSAMAMSDNGNGTFSVTLNLLPEHYEFKFINGNDWPFVEDVPNICQVELNGNDTRFIEVGADAATYAVCYASCSLCGTNAVLLRVDMSMVDADGDGITGEAGQDYDPSNLHVAGNFADLNYDNVVENAMYANWDPSFIALNAMGNGVYGVLLQLTPATYDYKFVNGNSWGFEEGANGACFVGGNRQVIVDQPNILTDAFCFGTCTSCVMPTTVTFRVNMSNETVSPNGVHIAGSFQGWNPGLTGWAMSPIGNNIYELAKELLPGTYEFQFVNGNDWSGTNNTNENNLLECSTYGNRILDVSGSEMIKEYCFNQCTTDCIIYGCMNSIACNYNSNANQDDGTCLEIGNSCDDNSSNTFNDIVTNNCICSGTTIVSGCTNSLSCNYNSSANQDDGSCLEIGNSCNDNLISTINDMINEQCLCSGNLIDLNSNNEISYNTLFYQAVVRNSNGSILANQSIPTRFSLHSTSPTGTIEYQETQNLTSNSLGLITTSFGLGQAVIGNFNTIPWGIGAKFLQVEINLNGWQTIGTQQLSAVPYAIRAKQVDADGLKLQSPSGNCFILQVDNNGNISTLAVPCQN